LDFPSPLIAGGTTTPATLPPAPDETIRLAGRGDLPEGGAWDPLPWPTGAAGALARQRWSEQTAPWQCVVAGALAPQGSIVQKGTPVLELRQTSVARLTTEVAEPYVGLCKVGGAVEVEFPSMGAVYRGLISHVEPTHPPRPPGAEIEILLIQDSGGGRLVYRDLEWMALLTYDPPKDTKPAPTHMAALFPLPCAMEQEPGPPPPDGQLSGRLELHSSARPSGFTPGDPWAQRKLERLREWHDSFVEGMKTTVFPESGLTLTYPRDGEVSLAVERMATRRVSHLPNMCARTMAEALGWGLGDAAMWAQRLPERGYELREDGIARPGDILVWPFTYGARRSQHVGLAVGQSGTIMLLSNEEGVLGTQPLSGGYLAFHKATAVMGAR
jgi:hypothetical protein